MIDNGDAKVPRAGFARPGFDNHYAIFEWILEMKSIIQKVALLNSAENSNRFRLD